MLIINNIQKSLRFQNFWPRVMAFQNFKISAIFAECLCKSVVHKYEKLPVGEKGHRHKTAKKFCNSKKKNYFCS